MSHEHKHGLFHHKKPEEEAVVDNTYTETAYAGDGYAGDGYAGATAYAGDGYTGATYSSETIVADSTEEYERLKREEKHHKKKEHLGETGALAAGAFALYEKHESKKDPEHAHKHKIEEEIAAAAGVGAGGYAFHEHHEKKEDKDDLKEVEGGKKKHHLFG